MSFTKFLDENVIKILIIGSLLIFLVMFYLNPNLFMTKYSVVCDNERYTYNSQSEAVYKYYECLNKSNPFGNNFNFSHKKEQTYINFNDININNGD